MTLDEAIKHAEEVAEEQKELYRLCPSSESEIYCDGTKDCKVLKDGKNKGCLKCAEEHRQLAEWLKELREIKNIVDSAEMIIEEEYGVVIVEGYVDVFDLIKKRVRLLEE